jgi:hypothetical protein
MIDLPPFCRTDTKGRALGQSVFIFLLLALLICGCQEKIPFYSNSSLAVKTINDSGCFNENGENMNCTIIPLCALPTDNMMFPPYDCTSYYNPDCSFKEEICRTYKRDENGTIIYFGDSLLRVVNLNVSNITQTIVRNFSISNQSYGTSFEEYKIWIKDYENKSGSVMAYKRIDWSPD